MGGDDVQTAAAKRNTLSKEELAKKQEAIKTRDERVAVP